MFRETRDQFVLFCSPEKMASNLAQMSERESECGLQNSANPSESMNQAA